MNIPEELKIFSLIYEYRHFILLPLIVLWIAYGCYLLFRLKKVFFLWLLIFPLVISPLQTACVYSGWHYRMELRNRFARNAGRKFPDAGTVQSVNINLMPPAIHAEYAKHNYRPRHRDIIAPAIGAIVFTPLLYALGGMAYIAVSLSRKWFGKRDSKQVTDT